MFSGEKIWILDGAMGTMIQKYGLSEEDFHGRPFSHIPSPLAGNNECLNLTRPDIIAEIHRQYIEAGADIIETNTFSANSISQQEYGCSGLASEMARAGAGIAREEADRAMERLGRKIHVAGSVGPTSKSLSLAPDITDPAFRPYSFDDMAAAYKEQIGALIEGGADIIQIETCFDALNTKAETCVRETYRRDKPDSRNSIRLCRRPQRTDTDRSDDRSLLYFRKALSSCRIRTQLLSRGFGSDASFKGSGLLGRMSGDFLPQRGPSQ